MSDSIYREVIMDHFRNPRNRGTLDPHDFTYQDTNPLCGDEVRIDIRLVNESVGEVRFSGRGCAISQASASILTEMVEGMSLDDVKALTKEDLLDELGIPLSPARLKCALLSLKVLKAGIYGVPQDEESL